MDNGGRSSPMIVAPDETAVRHSQDDPIYDYYGMTSDRHAGPEAFLGDLGPKRSTRNHFHPVDSFQLFWGSAGSEFEDRPVPKYLLHYSDAYGVYGGFSTNGERLLCFTLRPESSAFTAYMIDPARREFVPNLRNYDSNIEEVLNGLPAESDPASLATLFEPESDGLAAYLLSASPLVEVPPSLVTSPAASGSYVCVIEGTLDWGGIQYGPRSLAWIPPGADLPTLRSSAADETLRAVVMHFPSPLTSASRPFGN